MKSIRNRAYSLTIIAVIFLFIIFSVTGLVSIFGVAGCNESMQNDLQDKIDELQSQIEELEDRLAEMEEQIRDRDEKIEQLEKELAEKSIGTFYTLQEAYDNGWLTQEDLEAVAAESKNHSLGLPELAVQQAIIKDYLDIFKESSQRYPYATTDDIYIWRYYGDYHGSIVVQMSSIYTEYPSVTVECIVADIEIEYSGPDILVWRYN